MRLAVLTFQHVRLILLKRNRKKKYSADFLGIRETVISTNELNLSTLSCIRANESDRQRLLQTDKKEKIHDKTKKKKTKNRTRDRQSATGRRK